jgi:hypothetical protein
MNKTKWLLLSLLALSSFSQAWAGVVISGASPTLNFVVIDKNMLQFNVATATVNNATIYYTNLEADDNLVLKNSISVNTYGNDITIASGKTVTGTSNIFGDAAKSGSGDYTNVSGTLWATDPLFVSTSSFLLQGASPAKAIGASLGTGYTDFAGVSLPTPYGWPAGAYGYYSFGGGTGSFTGSIQ